MKRCLNKVKGLTLLEILGVVAVVITVATIAIISTKDTVSASQKATIQRELQQLNTALNNFEAAGGVIPISADRYVQQALDALKGGIGLADSSTFSPLVDDPELQVDVAGEIFNLDYDPATGFNYLPASGTGTALGGGGGSFTASGIGGAGSSFDFTDDADTAAAIETFKSLPYGHPDRAGIIEGFNAAKAGGYLSPSEQTAVDTALTDDGMVLTVGDNYVDAPFNFKNQAETQTALQNLTLGTPSAGALGYEAMLIALDKGASANPDLANNIGNALVAEYSKAVAMGDSQGVNWNNVMLGLGVRVTWGVDGRRFYALEVPPPQPPRNYGVGIRRGVTELPLGPVDLPQNLAEVDMEYQIFAGRDLSGHNFEGARFTWSDLSNATLPNDLDGAYLWHTNLSGVDMSGASLAGVTFAGSNLAGGKLPADLSGLGLEGTNLAGHDLSTKILRGTKLDGVDLTGQNFTAVDLTNTSLRAANLSGTAFSASANLANTDISQANLSGKNLVGWTLPNSLSWANLTGAVLPQNLSNKNFSSAQFGGGQFWGAYDLTGANFAFAKGMKDVTLPPLLSGANFTQVNLSGKNLSGANIVGANFSGANLTWTPLPTNLVNVNLRVTDLSGRNFSGSNLAGTNLQYANTNFASFAGARISGSTMAPDNTTANLDANGTGTWYGKTVINWIVQ